MKRESFELEVRRLEEELGRQASGSPSAEVRAGRAAPWLFGLAALAVVVGLLVWLPASSSDGEWLGHDSVFRLVVALAHLPVILAFHLARVSRLGRSAAGEEPRIPVAREAWKELQGGMTFLCAAWFALYVWMALLWSGSPILGTWVQGPKGLAVADVLNTLGSLAFFHLYLILDRPSVAGDGDPARHRAFRRALGLVFGVCAAAGLASVLGRLGYLRLGEIGPLSGSFVAAVAMMYFFGQLDYRYMRIRRWMIAPLYLYVAIQVAWPEIAADGSGWYPDALLVTALLGKVYLFALLLLWIRDRTLQKYLDFASL